MWGISEKLHTVGHIRERLLDRLHIIHMSAGNRMTVGEPREFW